jgi:hypothetical protein
LGFANDLGASWVRFQIPVNFYLTFRCWSKTFLNLTSNAFLCWNFCAFICL